MSEKRRANNPIKLVRAEYLIHYIAWLREIGAPIDRELNRARLPARIEEMPDEYVSLDLTYRFLTHCARAEGIDDLGFEAGWRVGINDFGSVIQKALCLAPTIRSRLECFSRFAHSENSSLQCSLQAEGKMTRIHITQYCPLGGDSHLSEWPAVKAMIEIIRSGMGQGWLPAEIGLASPAKLHPQVRDRLGDTRVQTGQATTFIRVPNQVLATPFTDFEPSTTAAEWKPASAVSPLVDDLDNGLADILPRLLFPYFASGYPSIDLAAEIVGTSVRSLQRLLAEFQTTYTELIDHVRFDRAAWLLQDSDLKIVDITLLLGYQDASNFSRAFRRVSGMSPREFRQYRPTTPVSHNLA